MGYKTLNLNNSFSDATFMREVLYFTAMRKYSPVPKSSFVKLMINGGNWGVYTHVQQLNSDLVDEWFTNDNGNRWKAGIPAGAGGGTQLGGQPGGGGRRQPGGGGGQLTLEIWLAGPAAADLNWDGQIDEADFAASWLSFKEVQEVEAPLPPSRLEEMRSLATSDPQQLLAALPEGLRDALLRGRRRAGRPLGYAATDR